MSNEITPLGHPPTTLTITIRLPTPFLITLLLASIAVSSALLWAAGGIWVALGGLN